MVKVVTHNIPSHLQQSLPELKEYENVSLVKAFEEASTLPRDNNIVNLSKKKKNIEKPKFLPILIGRGMSKDLKFLK